MSVPGFTSEVKPREGQFLGDLESLFRRHRLRTGTPGCLDTLATQFASSAGLRSDLYTLCTAISHMNESDMSAEDLLRLVARAVGGASVVKPNGEVNVPAPLRRAFLNGYTEWVERAKNFETWMQPAAAAETATPAAETAAPAAETVKDEPAEGNGAWQPRPDRFATAAALSGVARFSLNPSVSGASLPAEETSAAGGAAAGASLKTTERRHITPATRIGDLTISELRSYLDEIEHRVGRLQPYIDSLGREPEPVVRVAPASHAADEPGAAEAATEIALGAAEPGATQGAGGDGEWERVTEAPDAEAAAGEAQADELAIERTLTEFVDRLPLRSDPDARRAEAQEPEAADGELEPRRSSAWFEVAAAIVLVASGGALGYEYVQHVPEPAAQTAPVEEAQPASADAPAAPEATAPQSTGADANAQPAEAAVERRRTEAAYPAHPAYSRRQSRADQAAAQPEQSGEPSPGPARRPAPIEREPTDSPTANPPQ